MPEWVLELTVPVAPEHVGERLTNRRARPHRLREHGLGVSDVEGPVPPIEDGASTPISANSSARCNRPSAIRNWTDINRPSGTGIRLISSPPKAER
jgi:hypothetical protein